MSGTLKGLLRTANGKIMVIYNQIMVDGNGKAGKDDNIKL
jgi:hypothetical protein